MGTFGRLIVIAARTKNSLTILVVARNQFHLLSLFKKDSFFFFFLSYLFTKVSFFYKETTTLQL